MQLGVDDLVCLVRDDVAGLHLTLTSDLQRQYALGRIGEFADSDAAYVYQELADAFPHVGQRAEFVLYAGHARGRDCDSWQSA